jgi:hypothetical protein
MSGGRKLGMQCYRGAHCVQNPLADIEYTATKIPFM